MGYHWNRLDEHVFMACLLFTITQLRKLHLFKRDISTVAADETVEKICNTKRVFVKEPLDMGICLNSPCFGHLNLAVQSR